MQEFLYRALDGDGQTRTGSVRGASIEAALEKLEQGGLCSVKLEPRESPEMLAKASAGVSLYDPAPKGVVPTVPLSMAEMHEHLRELETREEEPPEPAPRARATFVAFLCGSGGGASLPLFYFGWVPRWEFLALVGCALVLGAVLLWRSQTRGQSKSRATAFLVGSLVGGLGACAMRVVFSLYFWLSGLNWTLS